MFSRRSFLASCAAPAVLRGAAPAPGPSVLLISAWNLYNIGDVAHTPGFLQLARKHFPAARITLLAASYQREISDYLLPKFPGLEVLPMEFKAGKPLSAAMQAAFASADLLVLNSGMTLSYGYYGLTWDGYIPRLAAFMKAHQMGIPFGIYGHSFDKVEPQADIVFRDVLSRAAFIYTRDTESLALLRSTGVNSPEMGFGPDAAFGFHLLDEERGERFLKKHDLEPGRFLAFIPRLDVNRFRKDGREKAHAEQTRRIITEWVRATGLPVALVPEVKKEIESARSGVYDLLPEDIRAKVRFQPEFWMPDEAQYVYSRALAVASAEMHSVILGLAAGTPSVHFYFQQAGLKQWMMRDIGLEPWLLDQDRVPPEKIAETLAAIARDPRAARRETARAMDFVRQRQAHTMGFARRAAEAHYRKRPAG